MKESYGRIDWMPKLKVWKIIGYFGKKDIEVGRVSDYDTAKKVLQDWYEGIKFPLTKAEKTYADDWNMD